MARQNVDRDRLWGEVAVAWQLIDDNELAEVQRLSSHEPESSIEQVLQSRAGFSKEDRDALAWMVNRLSLEGQATSLAPLMSTLQLHPPQPSRSESKFESTIDQSSVPGKPPEVPRPLSASYTRQRLHATGGIGQVWVARDHAIERDVAIKELRPDRPTARTCEHVSCSKRKSPDNSNTRASYLSTH
jgi:hypothetical protein